MSYVSILGVNCLFDDIQKHDEENLYSDAPKFWMRSKQGIHFTEYLLLKNKESNYHCKKKDLDFPAMIERCTKIAKEEYDHLIKSGNHKKISLNEYINIVLNNDLLVFYIYIHGNIFKLLDIEKEKRVEFFELFIQLLDDNDKITIFSST